MVEGHEVENWLKSSDWRYVSGSAAKPFERGYSADSGAERGLREVSSYSGWHYGMRGRYVGGSDQGRFALQPEGNAYEKTME